MNRRTPLIAIAIFLVLAILMVVFLVLPKMSDVGEAEDTLAEAESQEIVLQAELGRLRESAEEAARLRAELARARRAVPPVADLPGLINELQTTADVAGVDFFSIAPGAPLVAQGASATEIPAQIQVIGGFFAIDEFLFRLETMPRASKVVTITVAEGATGLPEIDVSLDVRFYTTDLEAGPGAPVPLAPSPEAVPSPSPGASPAPGETPATIPSPTPGA